MEKYQIWFYVTVEHALSPNGFSPRYTFDGVVGQDFDTEDKAEKYLVDNRISNGKICKHITGNKWEVLI